MHPRLEKPKLWAFAAREDELWEGGGQKPPSKDDENLPISAAHDAAIGDCIGTRFNETQRREQGLENNLNCKFSLLSCEYVIGIRVIC